MADNNLNTIIPLTFELYDFFNENDRNLLYIDDEPSSIKLNLEITNNSGKTIKLDHYQENLAASPDNFHLELQFRPGELSESSLKQIDLDENSKLNWSMSRPVEVRNGSVYLYLLKKNQPLEIPEKDQQGKKGKQIITLKGLAANSSNGVRGTGLDIRYKDFYFDENGQKGNIQNSSLLILTILGRRGLRKAPLPITFAYDDSILNNGDEELIVIRFSNIGKENIVLNKNSKFIITIDTEGEKEEPWSLIKKDAVKSIELKVETQDSTKQQWFDNFWITSLNDQGKDPEWTLTPNLELNKNLGVEQDTFVVLKKVKTQLRSGLGNIYVRYEGLPGYERGEQVLGVRKTNLIERDKRIGIGTYPTSELDVKGTIRADSLSVQGSLKVQDTISATSFIGEGAAVTGMIMMWYGQQDNIPKGWALCDGQNGTPDLRDRFIIGAGNKNKGTTGGKSSVTLTVENMPSHQHRGETSSDGQHSHGYRTVEANANDVAVASHRRSWNDVSRNTESAGQHRHTFTTDSQGNGTSFEILPPYTALFFIMKL